METLVKALGPAIVAAFAIQQLLEILDPLVSQLLKPTGDDEKDKKKKKLVLGIATLILGLVLAFGFRLRIMQAFDVTSVSDSLDAIVTAVIISAGTEGSNSILKVLEYFKEFLKKGNGNGDGDGDGDGA